MDAHSGITTPPLHTGNMPLPNMAPIHYWHNRVLKNSGHRMLCDIVANIKDLCHNFPPRLLDEICIASEDKSDI